MAPPAMEKPRVMMVDDEEDFHLVVRSWLAPSYELVSVTDPAQLAVQLEAHSPDLLILDVRLPGTDGFTLASRLRAERRYDQMPILFLTGQRRPEDLERHALSGAATYLLKPVGRRRLLSALRELLPDAGESIGTGD